MGIAYTPRTITDGLVLCLDAANPKSYPGSGTTWTDLSGNGNNGTLVNGVGYSGSNGGSLVFDGVDDYVSLPTSFLPNQLFADSNGSWSVSCWFKFPVNPTGTKSGNQSWSVIGRAGGIAGEASFIIFVGSETDTTYGNYAPFKVASAIRGAVTVISNSVNTNIWNNVVLTWSGNIGNYYFNNQQGSLNIGSADLQDSADFYIGSNPVIPSNHYYNGNIANTSIYNRALTATEISQNYFALKNRFGL